MRLFDKNIHQFAAFARKHYVCYKAAVPINQAAAQLLWVQPYAGLGHTGQGGAQILTGTLTAALFGWQVDNVQCFCTATAATASVDVVQGLSGNVVAGPNAPVAGSVVQLTLGTLAARRGRVIAPTLSDGMFTVRATTNGTGTITNLLVTVTLRPFPLDNEAA